MNQIREAQREQARALARRGAEAQSQTSVSAQGDKKPDAAADGAAKPDGVKEEAKAGDVPPTPATANSQASQLSAPGTAPNNPQMPQMPRQPWELVEEVLNILKTAFPLLALSMEKMVDQIQSRAKPPSDEDIYRFFAALLVDAIGVSGSSYGDISADNSPAMGLTRRFPRRRWRTQPGHQGQLGEVLA